jgi:diguanylate cyclase
VREWVGRRLWLLWLGIGAAATAAYFLAPSSDLVSSIAYDLIGLVAAVMMIVGVRLHRPSQPGIWYWFAAGQTVWVAGDAAYTYYSYVLYDDPFPSIADALYIAAYPLFIAGFLLLVRNRSRRDAAGLVDAAIVATGLSLVCWAFIMRPIAANSTDSVLEKLVGMAYPAVDVLLLAMLARVLTSSGARTMCFRLLLLAGGLLLAADIGYSLVTLYSDYDGGLLDAGWLLSYVLWGAAALHPSIRVLVDANVTAQPSRVGRGRLTLLAASSLLAPGVLFVQGVTAPERVDWFAIGTGAVVLFLLVLVRMSGFVTQVQRQADQLTGLVMQDDLTGLPNRRLFEDRLRSALAGEAQVALVDLDEFKSVNDRLGHPVGDQLLVAVGQRLVAVLRSTDTVARLGGDEFAILLPDTGVGVANDLVERVLDALQRPVRAGEHELLVGASIGVVDATGVTDPVEVMRRADVAMYAGKDLRGMQVRYRSELDVRATEEARLGAQLRTALDTGQFRLVYQPIVALPDGETVAVEALVRWEHPGFGLVSPATFVPVAERNGLIVELGAWVLNTACAQAAAWRSTLGDHAPGRISVNVSARQLAEPGFADMVAAALAATDLPASCLAIEVTETAVFAGGRALDALHAVDRLGVRIALDDFGTGHSSLGLLQTVPVDILKVDKSFVDSIALAGRHAVIATALIHVSDGLGLIAVAEGVETPEQAAELYRLGYRYAQGYHFGRPVAEPQFTPAWAAV